MTDSTLTECPIPAMADWSRLTEVKLAPTSALDDFGQALALADTEAARRLPEPMLLSWYDRDRNFESPQHVGECHQASATPGYVDYALHRGATLRVDIEGGRFVFFYLSAVL